RVEAVGTIGNGSAGPADVDFYQFTLGQAARVRLTTLDRQGGSPLVSVLRLYNTDPPDPAGYRLLAPDDGTAPGRGAPPGPSCGAAGGGRTAYSPPPRPGRGSPARPGPSALLTPAADAGVRPGDGPAVLAADPAGGASLPRSPLALRLDLSGSVDPCTLQ